MGWGKYSPVFCRIYAHGRKSDPSFGSEGFTANVLVGVSLRDSRELVEIRVTPDTIKSPAKLFINGKEHRI